MNEPTLPALSAPNAKFTGQGFLKSLSQAWHAHKALQRRTARRMEFQERYRGQQFEIGRFSYGEPTIHFDSSGSRLSIGQFCSIGEDVTIFMGGEHRPDWVTTYPFSLMIPGASQHEGHPKTKGDVIIGNDVWLGFGSTVLSGVRIGDGAVIGAGAVVAKDIPPYAIAVGNPARVIRSRFTPAQVTALLRIQWWDWPMEKIEAQLPLLLSGQIDAFIAAHLTPA
ncbi:MAG TPA: CatB-related O-acetyltransferase [Burkholderiaceae bacterium]|jgi:acetyltransferase-like isoleucine patch superfamily enzyme